MGITLPRLRREEVVALSVRALFEQQGYQLYRMGSFEEYDLYMQNKPFLMGDDIITFTSADGRLLALKPDVTLSIVKNTPPGAKRRVYYTENVFRRSRHTGEYREISQMGLECIGYEQDFCESEVLALAAKSLNQIGSSALDISHMEFVEALLAPFGQEQHRQQALDALRNKSPHGMQQAAKQAGLSEQQQTQLGKIALLSGEYQTVLPLARQYTKEIPGAQKPLADLESLCEKLLPSAGETEIRIDFSILNDADYYNGLIFQGFVQGIPTPVLFGGRYDNLLRRFDKTQPAIGFALVLDAIGRASENGEGAAGSLTQKDDYLNVALPKGRMGQKVYRMFEKAGFSCPEVLQESRKLVFEDSAARVRYFLVKPSDVDIYVERGAADVGVVGKDVLLESSADVLELLDLGLGACRLAVAGRSGFEEDPALPLRVASKYPAVARRYYASKSRSVEIIKLHGSIELAPLIGLSDVIVDIVETGSTLKENNLAVLAEIAPSSARLIANRASWRFKGTTIQTLLEGLHSTLS